jgi:5'(3')-deoxyribonucleotidase
MAHAPRFLVDVDEVLADFQTPAFQAMKKVTGLDLTPNDFEVWDMFEGLAPDAMAEVWAHIDQRGWCRSLKPFPAAQEGIERVKSLGFKVYAVTSPHHNEFWYHERVEWLKEHFELDKRHIVQTREKFLVQGNAFMDDNPEHVKHWREAHPNSLAMLWHIENTRTLGMDDIRVKSWDEVVERLKGLLP